MKHDYEKEPYEKMLRDNPDLGVSLEISIKLHRNGSLSVSGPVDDEKLCLALLENAKAAITRRRDFGLILPEKDVGLNEQLSTSPAVQPAP